MQEEEVQEIRCCDAADVQEDLRLVRAAAALGAADAAAAACAARSRLQRPQ